MTKLIRMLGLSIVVIVVCGCEKTPQNNNRNYYSSNTQSGSVTVRVENQSPYEIVVFKGDAVYARLQPGGSVGVYAYLVGDQKLSVAVLTPTFGVRKSFDRYETYSNFVVYANDYDVDSEYR